MKNIFLFISLLIFTQISLSQEISEAPSTQKVGLVLSGGGAKGLAHIGVLKVIDSLGIKIDYIGGTSMGAIIGGLYASGYTGKELDSIFNNVDTEALLQDFTPRDSKNFYQKRNDEIYALTLPFDNFKIGLPSALSKGLYNYNLLSKLTMHVAHIKDFSKLPIPFLCVATDVGKGTEVILDNGILPQSMIASGALPTLYNPLEINGRLLVDGGVVNNYPVEELRRRGANVIIGVDVQDNLKDREDLKGASNVLVQISNFSMIEKMDAKRKATDIYIKPDIKGFTVVSFDRGEEIIPKGIEAALKFLPELEQLNKKQEVDSVKRNIKHVDSIHIRDIYINPLENYTRAYVIGKLKFKNNSKISFKTFEKGINNLNASQNFNTINYAFEDTGEGERLMLDLKEKKSNMFLRFGVHYDNLLKSAFLLNFTKKKLIFRNDVLSWDIILGDNFRYNLNYYIDNGFYWSFGLNSKLISFNKNVQNDFNNGTILTSLGVNTINIDYLDLINQAYVQTIFAQKFSIGAGVEHKYLKIKSQTLLNVKSVFENSNYLSAYGFMKFDSFDQKYFPKKGGYFNGEIKSYLFSSDFNNNFEKFTMAKADMGIAQTFFKRLTLKLQTEGGFSVSEKTIDYFDFVLGGYGNTPINNFRPFFGYDFISLAGDSYVKGSVALDYEFLKKHHFNVTGNFANLGNKIFKNVEDWLTKPSYTGYAFGYGLETIVGPIEIKYSWSPETHKQYTWVVVGFWF